MKRAAVLPGDGVGPEVIAAAVAVIRSVTDKIEFITADIGYACYKGTGEALPRATMDALDGSDAVLMGTVACKAEDKGYRSPVTAVNKRLSISSRTKHFYRLSEGAGTGNIDCFLITEDTEVTGLNAETETLEGVTIGRRIEYGSCRRLCRTGRAVAEKNGIEGITLAHDGDDLPGTKAVLLKEFRDVMNDSAVRTEEMSYIDVIRTIMSAPERIRLVISTGLRGDLLDSIMTTAAGRERTMPVAGIGEMGSVFGPDHGPMYELTGLNRVNPTAAILAGSEMLDHLGHTAEGARIRDAVKAAYAAGRRTPDEGGSTGTYEFADVIISLCENVL